jgi:hypothetical protein
MRQRGPIAVVDCQISILFYLLEKIKILPEIRTHVHNVLIVLIIRLNRDAVWFQHKGKGRGVSTSLNSLNWISRENMLMWSIINWLIPLRIKTRPVLASHWGRPGHLTAAVPELGEVDTRDNWITDPQERQNWSSLELTTKTNPPV